MPGIGNEAQVRVVAEQVVEAAIVKLTTEHPEIVRPVISPVLKWVAGLAATVMALCLVGGLGWVVSTLSSLQQTVTRIDERQQLNGDSMGKRIDAVEGRVTRLEAYHQRLPGEM